MENNHEKVEHDIVYPLRSKIEVALSEALTDAVTKNKE